jgi:DNA polymerase-1
MPVLREYKWTPWAEQQAECLLAEAGCSALLAVDTETEGLGFYDKPFCVTFTTKMPDGTYYSAYIDIDQEHEGWEWRVNLVKRVLGAFGVWVFHNAKFDLQKLELVGALPSPLGKIEDTQVVQYLLNEHTRKKLKLLAASVLGESTDEDAKLKVVRRKMGLKMEDGYYHLPRRVIIPYAMKDTEYTLRLYEALWPKLEVRVAADPAMEGMYDTEIRVSEVFRRMEARGFRLDMEYLERTVDEYSIRVMQGMTTIQKLSGVDDPKFSNSPKQLMEAFAKRGYDLDSTQVSELRTLDDDLARALLQFRSDQKMHKTYLRGLLDEQVDGLVHPWFNPVGARTGRTSSSSATGE